ncbi:MAG: glycosyltransferase family 1 protein [Hyphomicrobiales bacterium]
MTKFDDRKLLIVSDAWHPQVNGVVRSLNRMVEMGSAFEFDTCVMHPGLFKTIALPSYSEIRLSVSRFKTVCNKIEEIAPDCIHIATEGTLGWQARRWCNANNHPFTTSYHTQFPDYIAARLPVRPEWIYPILRKFHGIGGACLVPTQNVQDELECRGFENVVRWSRGVDAKQFQPNPDLKNTSAIPRFLYVGRLAVEKNIEAFLEVDVPGEKVVVGDGPAKLSLERKFPDAQFLGKLEGQTLADTYASCDVFVFPSRTDTFGIVLLEALACGLPVAAFPVTGPIDVVGPSVQNAGVFGKDVAVLDEDLGVAIKGALTLSHSKCRAFAEAQSWEASAAQFYGHVRNVNSGATTQFAA